MYKHKKNQQPSSLDTIKLKEHIINRAIESSSEDYKGKKKKKFF